MKDSRQAIDKLFAALRDSEVPPEMERRILQAIRERSEAHAASRWIRISSLLSTRPATPRPWFLATAVAGTAVACLAILAFHRAAQVPPAHQLPRLAAVDPSLTTTPKLATEISPPQSASSAKTHPRRHPSLSAADSLALAEMHAPSHPAPPMPLTEQERLLRRIARSGNHQELAALSPEMRARLDADDAAAFQNFFEPARQQPKPGDNE